MIDKPGTVNFWIDPGKKHMVSLTWSPEELNLYFDGQEIHSIATKDLDI